MTNIHDELHRLTPEPDMDFLVRLDQQIQAKVEQETTSPMITTHDNITPLFDAKRVLLFVGIFLMVLFSSVLLLTYSPTPENDLSATILETTPTIAAQDTCDVEPQSGWLVHIVNENDTLDTISDQYKVEAQELLDANCLTAIETGVQLYVPAEIGYAAIVPKDYIRAGETITEEIVQRAYFANLPDDVALDIDNVVGTVALQLLGPNQPFSTRGQYFQYIGYEAIEVDDQVYTAEEGKILFTMPFPFSVAYEEPTTLYFQGVQEGCAWVDRQEPHDHIQRCASGITLLPRNIPTGQAHVIYQGLEDMILEASLEDAILITSFRLDGLAIISDLPSHADQTLTVSLTELPVSQEQIDDGIEMKWRVTIDTCNAVLEEFLPCDGIRQVYKFEPITIEITQPANQPEAETFATITLSANDAEVLKWALENDAEITPVE